MRQRLMQGSLKSCDAKLRCVVPPVVLNTPKQNVGDCGNGTVYSCIQVDPHISIRKHEKGYVCKNLTSNSKTGAVQCDFMMHVYLLPVRGQQHTADDVYNKVSCMHSFDHYYLSQRQGAYGTCELISHPFSDK